MDATLQGDYSLEVIPGVHIAGRDLVLKDRVAGMTIASLDSYELRLALWPLLRKQVDIHTVALNGGSLDLDAYSAATEKNPGDSSNTLALPRIRSMDISGLRLLRSTEELLVIAQLSVKDFAAAKAFPIDFSIQLAGMPSPIGIQLAGNLEMRVEPLELLLAIDDLNLVGEDQAWPLGHGQLTWDDSNELLTGNIERQHFGFETSMQLEVQFADPQLIHLSFLATSPLNQLLSATLELVPESNEWLINDLTLGLDGQSVVGEGCFSTKDLPLVQLLLKSPRLDLDTLRNILPSELQPGDQGIGIPSGLNSPIDLRVAWSVEELRMEGAIARDARLLLGGEPACFYLDDAQSASFVE
jgi:hypothetical protein